MSRTIHAPRLLRRGVLCVIAAAAGTLALAVPASAHVTVQPSTATAGGYATLSFKVPTESDTASTTGIDVQFPADTPIASVSVRPKAGWTYEVTKGAPAQPLEVHGSQVNEVVTRITWTAQDGAGIRPGEFDTFDVSAGPLPEGVDQVVFKTLQTYSDGEVVRWIDVAAPGADEPANPAPTLTLTAGEESGQPAGGDAEQAGAPAQAADTSTSSSDGTARTLGIVGLVLGAIGAAAGALALVTARRRA